jgi:hypothetical protein
MRIMEPIRVALVFVPGSSVRPVWFDWRRRKHPILETTCSWEGKRGDVRLLHLFVRNAGGLYELISNTREQTRVLEGIEG